MDKLGFWSIVDSTTHAKTKEEQCEALNEALSGLMADEIISFQANFDQVVDKAFAWNLWSAAQLIAGKCSNEEFLDFRAWLVSKGCKVYESALQDADSLAEIIAEDENCFFDAILYVPFEAWSEKTGKGIDEFPESHSEQPEEPDGQEWPEEEVKSKLPQLAKRFVR